MKIAVLSYSLSGHNRALAERVSKSISATYLRVNESAQRDMKKIALDMLFGRIPKVAPKPEILEVYDFVLIISPVWVGKVASPIRSFLSYINEKKISYGFVSINGGMKGQEEKLTKELMKKAGKKPAFVMNINLADLVSEDKINKQKIKLKDKELFPLVERIKQEMHQITDSQDS